MNKTLLLLSLALLSFGFSWTELSDVLILDDAYSTAIDTTKQTGIPFRIVSDTLPPIQDRTGDYINDPNRNPIDLADPPVIRQEVEYDPVSGRYIVRENMGNFEFRPPTYLTTEEYFEYRRKQDQDRYFRRLGGVGLEDQITFDDPLADVDIEESLINRLFGSNEIDIRPQGGVDLTFAYDRQVVENPFLIQRQQRLGRFDFDMDIQMNVTGSIGEKLNLTTNFNNGATFNFDNQIKLDYNSEAFGEDDILKKIEAGNVSLPLGGTLIEGAQSLFGLKTELQFGHLRLTAIASQQQSQREKLTIEGGSQLQEFEVYADSYDENRHFFLSHYNRDVYETALSRVPQVQTLFELENIEVWITNERNEVTDTRDIVAFSDLGESERITNPDFIRPVFDPEFQEICDGLPLPDNRSNNLFSSLVNQGERIREIDQTVNILQGPAFNLQPIRDFEKVQARKLNPREYTVHSELGYISLNINVQPDQTVGVAYRYSYNGQIFKVGELSVNTDNVSADTSNLTNRVLFVKMLKSSTQRVNEPSWDLMMKNVYSLGAFQVNQEDFRLDIQYEIPGEGFQRFLPNTNLAGIPLVRVFNLDRLNTQTDPAPDGIFDYVPGLTINPTTGRIYFPVLEPFGSDLAERITDPVLADFYSYQQLYDSTIFQAREFPEKNRFAIRGSYKSSVQSEISLGAFNIPFGSERVTAGGAVLERDRDYTIDYNTGRIRILNDAILSSGVPINVSFEDNTIFSLQSKTMIGLRADYEVSDKLALGATFLQLFERPFTQKVNIGEDPINNRIYGLDLTFNTESNWLTRAVDKLPFYSTSVPSNFSFIAETAVLRPGHSRAINQSRTERGGIVYLDDFEGTANPIDLMTPVNRWFLASVPQNDAQNNNPLFPESREPGVVSGANRALLNWYRIDPQARQDPQDNSNIYTNRVPQTEVFPNLFIPPQQQQRFPFFTFDLSYDPRARGPYNYDLPESIPGFTRGVDLVNDPIKPVELIDPETRWGGIMREMTTNDFQSANIEFVEFWMLSPFLDPDDARMAATDADQKEGTLYLNFGNVSEDILKDSRYAFENGLPGPSNPTRPVDETIWGRVPVTQQINRGFDNTSETRESQDVGLDGINDEMEQEKFADYLQALEDANPNLVDLVRQDPANDNFRFFNDPDYPDGVGLLNRYTQWNNTEGNSANNRDLNRRQSSTNLPDGEDLNRDNTLNEAESYFQYEIPMVQSTTNPREFDRTQTPYITDRIEAENGRIWYRFRVPLNDPNRTSVGGIQDFRSIRFMRMYMRGFETQTVLRFARFELVRNSWRRYNREFVDDDQLPPFSGLENTEFSVDAVNIEENSQRQPFAYSLPVGIRREQSLGLVNTLQNEQSLALRIDNLYPGQRRAVFKYTEADMRLYDDLKMFVHAEGRGDEQEQPEDGELSLFVRFGSDFESNYYEYEVPLAISDPDAVAGLNVNTDEYRDEVWLSANDLDLPLRLLRDLKQERNDLGLPSTESYSSDYFPNDTVRHTISLKGNPNLGFVKVFMIGVRAPNTGSTNGTSVEVWVNELRLEGLDERGGVAAVARADVQLADLGTVTGAVNYNSIGFGALDNSVQERSREKTFGYDLAGQFNLDKFFPQSWGLRLPLYVQESRTVSTPEFDPYDFDIVLQDKLDRADPADRDSLREQTQDITRISAINLTDVGINPQGGNQGNPAPWDVENFSLSVGQTRTQRSDPFIASEDTRETTAAIDYGYSRGRPTYIEPFKGIKSKFLRLIKEININPLPNSFAVTNVLNRLNQTTQYRFDETESTYFNKRFTWDRNYNLQWDLTRSLKLNYNAVMNATIDEPFGEASEPDTVLQNLLDGGRPKRFQQGINVSYNLPIRFLPFMDWVDVRASYSGNYVWNAATLDLEFLGNTIQNSQTRQLTANLNFTGLYDQIGFLRQINQPQRRGRSRGSTNRRSQGRERQTEGEENGRGRSRENKGPSPAARALIRPLLMLRQARLTYSEDLETVLPGFLPSPQYLGLSRGFEDPGWGFVFGLQPNIRNLPEADQQGPDDWLWQNRDFLTQSPFLNQDVEQFYTQTWDAQVTVEPFRDFRIDLSMNRTFTENYSETFKVTEKLPGSDFEHAIPVENGTLSLTTGGFGSLFNQDTANLSALFAEFEANRVIISQRLGNGQPHEDPALAIRGFEFGYGPNQAEVILPAFLAAYAGEDARTTDLDAFDRNAAPNWRLTYNGLPRVGGLGEIFRRVNISHGFQSTFNISSFGTSLDFLDAVQRGQDTYDTTSLNFFPRIEIPNVSESKAFAPLLGIEAELLNGMSFNFSYQISANRSLNIVSKLVTENTVTEIVGGFGMVLEGVNIGFLTGKRNRRRGRDRQEAEEEVAQQAGGRRGGGRGQSGGRLNIGDLDFQLNFSFRDNITFASVPDQGVREATEGNQTVTFSPSAEYQINNQLALRAFFDYRRTLPYNTLGFPTTTARGGVVVRFQLQ
ncbi:MAG: cell surface protein SprA [Bacteroidota bacterium]